MGIHLVDAIARGCDWLQRPNHAQVTINVERRRAERSKSKKKEELQRENAQRRKDLKAAQEKEKVDAMSDADRQKYEEKKYRQEMRRRTSMAGMKGKTKMIRA